VNVFIPEVMPCNNHGETAILWGLRETLKPLTAVHLTLCSAAPESDRQAYGPDVRLVHDNLVTGRRTPLRIVQALGLLVRHLAFVAFCRTVGIGRVRYCWRHPLWKSYLDADLLLFGHDNVLVGRIPYHLCALPAIARLLQIPAVVCAGSVGPFSGWPTKSLTRWLLNRVDLVILREPISLEYVAGLKLRHKRVEVTTDPAFLMPPAAPERVTQILKEEGIPTDRPLIGFTVSQEMARRYAQHRHLPTPAGVAAYLQARAALLDHLVERHGAHIVGLAHCAGRGQRDDREANRLVRQRARHRDAMHLIERERSAQEIKGLIGRCALLIGERTHALIAAVAQGVPIVGVTSRITRSKTRGIIGHGLGLNAWIFDVESLDFDDLQASTDQAWEQRDSLAEAIRDRLPEVARQARRTGALLAELMARRGTHRKDGDIGPAGGRGISSERTAGSACLR
jgi:polysaccharide pyruvyl transferase WcaK-like protein